MPVDFDYSHLIEMVLEEGQWQRDRTSVGESIQLFGQTIRFNTHGQYAPFVQARTMAPRIAFEEWKWMMRGSTDATELQNQNIHIWDGNSTREFLDSRGLHDVQENHIGKAYGYQYRSFGGEVDQIRNLFNGLKNNPTSRRHIVSIWNPVDSPEMALEPCFHLYEFMYSNGTLNLYVHGRSSDVVFGLPYNFAFAYFWLLTFSRALGYKTGEILFTLTNAHVYRNQIDLARSIIEQSHDADFTKSIQMPVAEISKEINTLDDILSLQWSDILVKDWKRGPKLTDAHIEMAQ